MVRKVTHARKWNPLSDLDKILQGGRYPDIITYANFGEDELRGLEVVGGLSLPFFTDFDHRPYNTLALPCECVLSSTPAASTLKECQLSQRFATGTSGGRKPRGKTQGGKPRWNWPTQIHLENSHSNDGICHCQKTAFKTKTTQTWRLTVLSTEERFSGAAVEFSITFVSRPVYTTIPVRIYNMCYRLHTTVG